MKCLESLMPSLVSQYTTSQSYSISCFPNESGRFIQISSTATGRQNRRMYKETAPMPLKMTIYHGYPR